MDAMNIYYLLSTSKDTSASISLGKFYPRCIVHLTAWIGYKGLGLAQEYLNHDKGLCTHTKVSSHTTGLVLPCDDLCPHPLLQSLSRIESTKSTLFRTPVW